MAQGLSHYEEILKTIPGLICDSSLTTSDDGTNYQYHFVKMTADLTVGRVAGTTEQAIGVLVSKPTTGHAATVAGAGSVVKAVAGGTITAGQLVSSDASGHAVAGASSSYTPGIALEGASSGNLVTVLLLGGMDIKA
jgi:hypothetical protein